MSKGCSFGLPASAGVSLSFLSEKAGRQQEHEPGRGLGRAGSSMMVLIGACRGMEVCRSAHAASEHAGEVCKRRAFYSNTFGMCFTMAQTHYPRQGAALSVSTGSLSPFQPRSAVWGRLCQALAVAQEELQGCAKSQAVPLALIAACLPTPRHAKFPAFVTAANTTGLCNEGHCPRVPR